MGIATTRAERRQLARDNANQPNTLQEVPRWHWPNPNAPQLRVLRSRDFLVQEFAAPSPAVVRLSISRTVIDGDRWQDNIAWEDLQRLKHECGYANSDAVEVFPADADVVNVANMRHLWVLAEPVPFAWRKS
jgi:hypothetical protein